MIVDSWCRQKIWGAWNGGYYLDGKTKLPGSSPAQPGRSAYREACAEMSRPPY